MFHSSRKSIMYCAKRRTVRLITAMALVSLLPLVLALLHATYRQCAGTMRGNRLSPALQSNGAYVYVTRHNFGIPLAVLYCDIIVEKKLECPPGAMSLYWITINSQKTRCIVIANGTVNVLIPTGIYIANYLACVLAPCVCVGSAYCLRRQWRRQTGKCLYCGYSLVGLRSDQCPECGELLDVLR